MRRILASLLAVAALSLASVGSALASPAGNFPEGVPPAGNSQACTVLLTTPSPATGSPTGLANKAALYIDACLGGP